MSKYYPPKFNSKNFHCVHCNVYSAQEWSYLEYKGTTTHSGFDLCTCKHCGKESFWYGERMLIPTEAPVSPHHVDLPDSCIDDYNEARDVLARSPKAAAALMRLCIQKLVAELGEKGKNINDDIGALVNKGLPVEVQQALDYCRVIGNNAVHPGELNLDDDPNIAHSMFEMVNFIVEDRITKPKKIAELYKILPEGALKAVERRDSK
ncbi:DUF4145 domain-containing protein [Thalassomonas actiniarum]|uniref:DUF4145 domain-containing protein n=1 Tax=Thalassomonas actiniarum TaxID=485447 RepID=A0AAE9YW65_9GAMM|nr:DUF4145 domain-containing protein [Thalassomonas actiniarum]WDE01479.1 DUF4145 domain-containing protein [Thalassomonas actiniarum]